MSRLTFAALAVFCGAAAAQPQPDPISVGIVLDSSGSIGAKQPFSRQILDEFLKTARPQDEFVLVKSADHPSVETGLSSNADQIRTRVPFFKAAGRSAILDAIQITIAELKQANNTHTMVLLISDGLDNASSNSKTDVEELARKSDVRIFTIALPESSGTQLLSDLADRTGGRYFAPTDAATVARALSAAMRK